MLISLIIFWGNDYPIAKQMALDVRRNGGKAVTRDASVFAGDVELCDKVMLMPSVHPFHLDRIVTAYGNAGIPIERYSAADLPKPAVAAAPEVISDDPLKTAPVTTRELMRLTSKQLTELAHERGIVFDTLDRASMISALSAAAKEPPP
jgi:hypothetical protein